MSSIPLEKRNLGIVASYGVNWSIDKILRDFLQNFFDGNNGSLDGLNIRASQKSIILQGKGSYDFSHLLFIGGTTKQDNELTAGGFGEGAKIAALCLLRDQNIGISQVIFSAQNWKLTFYLAPYPEYNNNLGLWVDIEQRKSIFDSLKISNKQTNSLTFVFEDNTKVPMIYRQLISVKDLFYHKENPDFQKPFDIENEVGKLRFENNGITDIKDPKYYQGRGNFYLVGQRIHVGSESSWYQLKNFTLCINSKRYIQLTRDRNSIENYKVLELINEVLKKATNEEIMQLFSKLINLSFFDGIEVDTDLNVFFVSQLLSQMKKRNLTPQFPRIDSSKLMVFDMIYSDPKAQVFLKEARQEGFVILKENFRDFSEFLKMSKWVKSRGDKGQLTQEQKSIYQQQIDLLKTGLSYFPNLGPPPEIQVFSSSNSENALGYFDGTIIHLREDLFHNNFAKALMVCLHEVSHRFGSDGQREFSDKLTWIIEVLLLGLCDTRSNLGFKLKMLDSSWEKTQYGKKSYDHWNPQEDSSIFGRNSIPSSEIDNSLRIREEFKLTDRIDLSKWRDILNKKE